MTTAPNILLVDDDIDVVEQLTVLLEGDYRITSASSQQEAETLLESYQPDVAIVDLMMENMDSGFILAHRIKQHYPDAGVILLTGVASETGLGFDVTTDEEKSWVKADTIIDKPVRHEQLKAEIEKLLQPA